MTDAPPLVLPEPLRRTLPAARWELLPAPNGTRVYRSQRFIVKVQPREPSSHNLLFGEKERLRWLTGRVPVSQVVGYAEAPDATYLALTRVPGIPMSHPDARLHARRNADLLARALAELHALPVRDCPFTMTLAVRLRDARARIAASPSLQGREHLTARFNTLVRNRPAQEDLVVTHGQATLDHIVVNGEYVEAFLNVERAGLADRHLDLALAHRSLTETYDSDAAEHFLDVYGLARVDPDRLAYYAELQQLA